MPDYATMRIGLLPGVVSNSGGPSTYVTQLVRGLARVAPDVDLRTLLLGTRQLTPAGWRERRQTADLLERHSRSVRARPLSPRLYGSSRVKAFMPSYDYLFGKHDVYHQTHLDTDPPVTDRRLVITLHDLIAENWEDEGQLLPCAERLLARAAAVITVSETSRGVILARFPRLAAERIQVVWNGVDHERFHDRQLAADAQRVAEAGVHGKFLLYLGGLSQRKNVRTLIEAYGRARALLPGRPGLVLVGPWSASCFPLPLREGVTVLGSVPGDLVAALLRDADALVLPSREEGFGLPLLEAQACGTPVFCSDIPVFREIGGEAPIYVRTGNAEELSFDLVQAYHRLDLEAAGRTRAGLLHAADFTWERSAQKHAHIYREVARGAGIPPGPNHGRQQG